MRLSPEHTPFLSQIDALLVAGCQIVSMATGNVQESRGIVQRVVDDVTCLKSMWFAKGGGDNHAERLDSFYKPQAEQCALLSYSLQPAQTSLPGSAYGQRLRCVCR